MKAALGGLGMVSRPMAAITEICHRNLRLGADRNAADIAAGQITSALCKLDPLTCRP